MDEIKIGKEIVHAQKEGERKAKVFLVVVSAIVLFSLFSFSSSAYAGAVCGSTSPCVCGSNCSGGNELFGNSQSYCDSNAIECFNTIDNCRDGTIVSLNYVKDINVSSLNDSVFRVGDVIEIDATLFSSSANSEGVFFVYANATVNESVNWSVIFSTTFGVADSDYHIKYNYTIPNVVGDHTVRVIDEFSQVTNITCGRDAEAEFPSYSDTDDITFTVLPQPAPSINFTGPTPSNGTSLTAVAATINVSHVEAHPDRLILNWNGTNESYSYSGSHTVITKVNLKPGNYSFYVYVNDTYGNTNQTETRNIFISSPIELTVESPTASGQQQNNSVAINVSAVHLANKNITNITYQLNSNENVSLLSKKLNLSVEDSDSNGVRNESLIAHHNLSQSFIPNQDMNVRNISLKLKRTGLPNATLQIRADASNSTSSTVLANISVNNASVNSSSFEWVSFFFNESIALTNGTRYWLYLSENGSAEDHYSWESNDDIIYNKGHLFQNSSVDLLFRFYDSYRFRTEINMGDGTNNLTVFATDSDEISVSSSIIEYTVDSVAPAYSTAEASDPVIEPGVDQEFSIDVIDSTTSVDVVLIEFNNTNATLSKSGNTYSIAIAATILGNNTFLFYMNDSLGNMNSTELFSFIVQDTGAPTIQGVENTPNTAVELDPGVFINVTANITDPGGIDTVFLQYRNSSSESWINASMNNASQFFWGNFTPNIASSWQYRIWANDTSANSGASSITTLNISLDFSWTLSPSSLGALSGIIGSNVTLGNVTINNTGDQVTGFTLSSNRGFVLYNVSSSFALDAGSAVTLEINATTPLEESSFDTVVTVSASNASATPSSLQTNATLVAISNGPYLFLEIVQFNSSVTKPAFFDIKGKITNIGNETAYNVTANWTVASDWTSIPSDLNTSLGNISVNGFEHFNISVDIESTDSTGSKTITLYAQSDNGANNSVSESITVSAGSSSSSSSSQSSSSSSGGGGGGGGGGAGIAIRKNPILELNVDAPEQVEFVAPEEKVFWINLTNRMENYILKNLSIKTDGFLRSKINVSPESIESLSYLKKKKVGVFVTVPDYMKHQNVSLDIIISGIMDSTLSNNQRNASFEKKITVQLLIKEITKELAKEYLEQTWDELLALDQIANTEKLEVILDQAEAAFVSGNYIQTKELTEEILSQIEAAYEVISLLTTVQGLVDEAEEQKQEIVEVKTLLTQAQEEFKEGNFATAKELLENALLAQQLHVQRLESGFFFMLTSFFFEYWMIILLGIAVVGLIGFKAYRDFSVNALLEKTALLDAEEESVMQLIKKTQKQYFSEKIMSERMYHKTLNQYTKQIAQINGDKLSIRTRIIGLLKVAKDKDALKQEKDAILSIIKDIQQKYYVKKIVSKEAYQKSVEEYQRRVAEIEKALQLFDDDKEGMDKK